MYEAYTRSFFGKIHHSRPATHCLPTVLRSPTTNQSVAPIVHRTQTLHRSSAYSKSSASISTTMLPPLVVSLLPLIANKRQVSSIRPTSPDAPGTILRGQCLANLRKCKYKNEFKASMTMSTTTAASPRSRTKNGDIKYHASLPKFATRAYTASLFRDRRHRVVPLVRRTQLRRRTKSVAPSAHETHSLVLFFHLQPHTLVVGQPFPCRHETGGIIHWANRSGREHEAYTVSSPQHRIDNFAFVPQKKNTQLQKIGCLVCPARFSFVLPAMGIYVPSERKVIGTQVDYSTISLFCKLFHALFVLVNISVDRPLYCRSLCLAGRSTVRFQPGERILVHTQAERFRLFLCPCHHYSPRRDL